MPFEAFDEIHQVVLDRRSENMASLLQSGMYGAINIDDTTTNVFYVIISSQRHTHYKIIQQLKDKLFLLEN